MTTSKSPAGVVAAFSIFISGSAAWADVTPADVWGDWKTYLSGFGYELSSTETMAGGVLTVSDLEMAMALPEGGGRMTMTLDELSFRDNGDGTVAVVIPPVMPLHVAVDAAEGEDVNVTLDYTTKGLSMIVSGDADRMTYNYTAASLALALAEVAVDGQAVDLGHLNLAMDNVTGTTTMEPGDVRRTQQTFNTGAVTYAVDFADPEGGGRVDMSGRFGSMNIASEGSFPAGMDASNVAAMMAAGFAVDARVSYADGDMQFNLEDGGETVEGSSRSSSGSLTFAMDAGKLVYGGSAGDVAMQFSGGGLPFPVEMSMDEYLFNMQMPVAQSDEAQDFALGFKLGDFTMSDAIWSMFDPAGQLSRSPATLALDMTGKARLFLDLLDPVKLESLDKSGEVPGEINQLSLNDLTVRVAGAELTGEGAFTFDNSDLTTFDGIPAPTGAIDLKLVGGNGLLDNLIAMGLVPEDQAMGMRMMLGLFAVPGEGEDTLTSKIEVTGEGQVSANGQRLR